MKPTNPKNGPKHGMKLHRFIATGGSPKDFRGADENAVAHPPKETEAKIPECK